MSPSPRTFFALFLAGCIDVSLVAKDPEDSGGAADSGGGDDTGGTGTLDTASSDTADTGSTDTAIADTADTPPGDDLDGDGYPGGSAGDDCDDTDPGVNPGATEVVGNRVDEDCDGRAVLLEDDFEGGTDGGAVAGTGDWDCMGETCISVYDADEVYSGNLSLSTASGSGEVGQSPVPLDDDFALELWFHDPGATAAGNFMVLFWSGFPATIVATAGWSGDCGNAWCTYENASGSGQSSTLHSTFGARSVGWHQLVVTVDYAAGALTACVDSDCSLPVPILAPIDGFNFNEDFFYAHVDDLVAIAR